MRQSVGTSRRRFLRSTAATAGLALGAGALTQFPFVHAAEPVTLRIAGTGVNQFKQLADKCKADLGFIVQYTSLVSDDVVKRAVTQPSSFDLLDAEYWMLKKIVPSGNLRGIDRVPNHPMGDDIVARPRCAVAEHDDFAVQEFDTGR